MSMSKQLAAGVLGGLAHFSWPIAEARRPFDRHGAPPRAGPVSFVAQNRGIYDEGDEADTFFEIVAGVVRTCRFSSDGRRQIDAFYVAKEFFGFEPGAEHRLSAEAVSNCTLISYRRRGSEKSASHDQAQSSLLLPYVMRNMVRAQEHALLLRCRSAVEKVGMFLMEWAAHSPNAQVIVLEMTRRDIGDYLGITIETVSRSLAQLERAAVIELSSAREIRIRDPVALRELNA
jgi:CRP/FNR family nitrogen fixation transcriptional regulator